MSTKNPAPTSQNSQAGMVAIMVTLILMIVISLIVLGFAQISRRNQRQALDRQLSTQAFYAAETGVNDAAKLIKDALAAGTTVPAKPDCASTGGGFYSTLSPVLDAAANVQYTCLIVDPSPSSLVYGNIGAAGTVIPILAASGTIDRITLNWQSKDISSPPATNCPTTVSSVFSTSAAWSCGYGVLRFDVVPTAGGGHTVTNLQSATMSAHIVPLRPGSSGGMGSVSYNTTGANNRIGVVCSNASCTLNIDFAAPQSQYYMRVNSLYKDVSLNVIATSGGSGVDLIGTQALIDVTGKAEDVLRRIQVRLPLASASTNQLSDYALSVSRPICKRFSVMDGFFLSDADNAVPGVGAATSNPLCQ